jgi:glycosyltransferase involved in cell wall biosynthesis
MTLRLAAFVSHPIQHFAPWHREIAKRHQIDLKVFFLCDWGSSEYVDPEFQAKVEWDVPLLEGYQYEFLPIAKRPTKLNFWQVDNPTVARALDSFQPDVIQVFGYAYRTNWRVARWTKRAGKPLLIYSDSNARAIAPLWKRLPKQVIVREFYRNVDGALYVGDNNREYHRRYGIPDDRLFAGMYPVDADRLLKESPDSNEASRSLRRRLGIPENAFVVLFCGKYSARKRPLDLLVAANAAVKKGLPVWCLFVGEGAKRLALEAYCAREGFDRATFTGFVNQSTIPEYYRASDVLAVTSSEDPHPLVVSEAAVFGLPAIVSDRIGCIGPNDTARPDFNALVYPCGDTEKLGEAIERLCSQSDTLKEMSAAARIIAADQNSTAAAEALAKAVEQLHSLGPR